ncbi:hypothetical protein [Bosea sp. CS1GBMeth4]|nr:hypothetical protein [Bosea sp. CS1GBMeth4]
MSEPLTKDYLKAALDHQAMKLTLILAVMLVFVMVMVLIAAA